MDKKPEDKPKAPASPAGAPPKKKKKKLDRFNPPQSYAFSSHGSP